MSAQRESVRTRGEDKRKLKKEKESKIEKEEKLEGGKKKEKMIKQNGIVGMCERCQEWSGCCGEMGMGTTGDMVDEEIAAGVGSAPSWLLESQSSGLVSDWKGVMSETPPGAGVPPASPVLCGHASDEGVWSRPAPCGVAKTMSFNWCSVAGLGCGWTGRLALATASPLLRLLTLALDCTEGLSSGDETVVVVGGAVVPDGVLAAPATAATPAVAAFEGPLLAPNGDMSAWPWLAPAALAWLGSGVNALVASMESSMAGLMSGTSSGDIMPSPPELPLMRGGASSDSDIGVSSPSGAPALWLPRPCE